MDLATGEKVNRVIGLEFFRMPNGTYKAVVAHWVRGVEVAVPAGYENRPPVADAVIEHGRVSMREINLYPGVHLDWGLAEPVA